MSSATSADDWVVDASVFVDLVIRGSGWQACRNALGGARMHAPAHVDVEVMSALGRLQRASLINKAAATRAVDSFLEAPIQRHDLPDLARGAWRLSRGLRISDALYVELARQLGVRVLTVDARLARASELAVVPEG